MMRAAVYVGFLLLPTSLFADSNAIAIKIFDCTGSPRLAEEIAAGEAGTIDIAVSRESYEGAIGTLSALGGTGESQTQLVHNGWVAFKNVTAGSWKVCFDNPTVEMDRVTLSRAVEKSSMKSTSNGATLGGAAAILVGGGALALALSSGSDDGDSVDVGGSGGEGIPTGSGGGTPTKPGGGSDSSSGGSGSGSGGGAGGVGIQAVGDEDCFISDDVDVLSPFR